MFEEKIIDGRKLALEHELALARKLQKMNGRPKIVSVLVGSDPGSVLYTKIKQQKANVLGIGFEVKRFDQNVTFEDIAQTIRILNADLSVTGVMIQLPLPLCFSKDRIKALIEMIVPEKDVDGLLPASPFLAATVKGVISLLEDEQVELSNKVVVVVGSEGEVGSRLVKILRSRAKKVIEVDKDTQDIGSLTLRADVLISSTGQMHLIKGDMVKKGVVVIDVGSEKLADGRVVGDVEFESVAPKASKITPVPGGVGPMTVISLMENVVESGELNYGEIER